MNKKYIDIMDTTFRDGFQSVFGARVLTNDFLPALEAAKNAGITHFEFGGGARFQALYFYLQEDAFEMMDKFREVVGKEANLQTLARGINTVMLDTGSSELIDLHAKLFAKHGTTTIRNFDALNDMRNLQHSGESIKKHGMAHEAVITMMDLPPNSKGAHDVPFYEKKLRELLDLGIPYDSICFKDASGTSSPAKVYETIKMARDLLGEHVHIRLHTHETAGVSVACYLAALEAGANGIDLANTPVSGGTSQPDILTLLHATKGMPYNLGDLNIEKITKYQEVLQESLKDYFLPPEATKVNPIIPQAPMPGGALTANTQMMRDNNTLDKFPEVLKAMQEVVEKGGFGTSVTPVSQFYWQQAYANVNFGPWEQIAPGYGKMVLGYFGKTPVEPDEEIVKLASEKLNLQPTTVSPLELANQDEKKSIKYWEDRLKSENLDTNEENIFIAAACQDKGIAFLKGQSPLMVRKNSQSQESVPSGSKSSGIYTVVVDGEKFDVVVKEGSDSIDIDSITKVDSKNEGTENKSAQTSPKTTASSSSGEKVLSPLSGNVFKILKHKGDSVKKDEAIMILEAMKMEIEVVAPIDGTISDILVSVGDSITESQTLAVI